MYITIQQRWDKKNALCSIHQKVIYLMKFSVDNQDQVQVISDLFNM